MIDFAQELENILSDDPLDLLAIKAKTLSAMNDDERLIASFEEINQFVRKQGHEPTKNRDDINERSLFSRLEGLRNDIKKVKRLMPFDCFKLLETISTLELEPEAKEITSVSDILVDDILGLLGEDENDIFTLKNVSKTLKMPEKVAQRKPCKNFANYEALFKQCHADLVSEKSELKKFTGEQQITTGHFFILHGVMVYVAKVGKKSKKRGKVNARLRCIFENGTESNMLLRSLATELYKDENGRRILSHREELFDNAEKITPADKATGYIYILRSLSDDPQIKAIKNLYKIGFSRKSVTQRIANAHHEPTYLMAKVQIITEYQAYNLNPHKLETLLHTFFAESCLNLEVFNQGQRYSPREWFIVPLAIIETTVQLLRNGEIIHYRYDREQQEIFSKE
ncbi:MAG: GIY-YIG nuclease family protein [Methylococcales bacterium]|nr:GIY-YIG nuclease family protein [Methylococcales bacterium]